jgi:hypothetical protein
MMPLEKIEDILGIMQAFHITGLPLAVLLSELNPGKNWREIVKQDSKPNEE